MIRDKDSQSKHDEKVKEIAKDFEQKGFSVKADIEGYSRPGKIKGFRPDVVAIKDKQTKIVEVETKDSNESERSKQQQVAFREEADSNKNTTFKKRIAK